MRGERSYFARENFFCNFRRISLQYFLQFYFSSSITTYIVSLENVHIFSPHLKRHSAEWSKLFYSNPVGGGVAHDHNYQELTVFNCMLVFFLRILATCSSSNDQPPVITLYDLPLAEGIQ